MMSWDDQHVVAGLMLLATVMYLLAVAPGFRRRRTLRIAAIAAYAMAFLVVVGLIVVWLARRDQG